MKAEGLMLGAEATIAALPSCPAAAGIRVVMAISAAHKGALSAHSSV